MSLRRLAVLIPALLIFGGVLVVAACGSEEPALPVISADSVIAYLDEVDYQESWELWPGRGEKYQGDDPHGALLTTYLNPAAFEALDNKAGVLPNGAIVVKENYTPGSELAAITVMYKRTGYNPDHNDWFWLKVLADGTVEKEGMVMGCQECHGDVKDNDYIWTGPLEVAPTFSILGYSELPSGGPLACTPRAKNRPRLLWSPAQPDTSAVG